MLWLGAGCLTIYIIRLVFRAFFYADMYIAPNDPYGISDVIELLLGAASNKKSRGYADRISGLSFAELLSIA